MKPIWALLPACAVALLVVGGTRVIAQNDTGQAIQVSPVLVELNATPGGTYKIKLNLTNVSAGALRLVPSVNDFRAKDESGTPEILFEDEEDSLTYSLRQWIRNLPELQLEPKQSQVLEVDVTVPEDAEPGGHYGVIRYSGAAPDVEESGVALSASIGVLVLARVDGDVNESLRTEEFFVAKSGEKRGWVERPPVTFVTRLRNDGNVHLKPKGDIVVKNMFGSVVAELPVNAEGRNILPNSIRRFEHELPGGLSIGRYTAETNLAYGTSGQVLQDSISFWVVPYKLILLCLAIFAATMFIIIKLVKYYNRMIIERAKKQNKE